MTNEIKKNIGKLSLLLFGINSAVGSGWLFGPFYSLKIAGPAASLSWILGGVMIIVIAAPFIVLCSSFPASGGIIQYASISQGVSVSRIVGWLTWLGTTFYQPIETQSALQYSSHFFPGLFVNDRLTALGLLVATIIMLALVLFNYFGIALAKHVSNVLGGWKTIIPIVTIIVLFFDHFSLSNFSSHGGFMPFGMTGLLAAISNGGILFSYVGFLGIVNISAEVAKPKSTIPFGIIGSTICIVIMYVALQTAFTGSLPAVSIHQGWQDMQVVGQTSPLVTLASLLGLGWLALLLYTDSVISPVGAAFITTVETARISYAIAEIGMVPKIMKKLNRYGVPHVSLIVNFVVSMLFFLPFHGWQEMVSMIVSVQALTYAFGPIVMHIFYIYNKQNHSKLRRLIYMGINLLSYYFSALLIYWSGWSTVWHLTIFMGIVFFCLFVQAMFRHKTLWPKEFSLGLWLIPYIAGMFLISYLGDFGGTAKLSLQSSSVYILLICVVTYVMAINIKLPKNLFKQRLSEFLADHPVG
ncbi:MAG: APC family permease [Pseudomonadota bacterium]